MGAPPGGAAVPGAGPGAVLDAVPGAAAALEPKMADMIFPKILIHRSRVALRKGFSPTRLQRQGCIFCNDSTGDPNCGLYGAAGAFSSRGFSTASRLPWQIGATAGQIG